MKATLKSRITKLTCVSLTGFTPYPDKILGEVVWLVVVPDLGKKITEEEVLKRCEEQLAKFKVPRKIIIYPLDPQDPPVTRIGKIDRVRLKKELFPPEA